MIKRKKKPSNASIDIDSTRNQLVIRRDDLWCRCVLAAGPRTGSTVEEPLSDAEKQETKLNEYLSLRDKLGDVINELEHAESDLCESNERYLETIKQDSNADVSDREAELESKRQRVQRLESSYESLKLAAEHSRDVAARNVTRLTAAKSNEQVEQATRELDSLTNEIGQFIADRLPQLVAARSRCSRAQSGGNSKMVPPVPRRDEPKVVAEKLPSIVDWDHFKPAGSWGAGM